MRRWSGRAGVEAALGGGPGDGAVVAAEVGAGRRAHRAGTPVVYVAESGRWDGATAIAVAGEPLLRRAERSGVEGGVVLVGGRLGGNIAAAEEWADRVGARVACAAESRLAGGTTAVVVVGGDRRPGAERTATEGGTGLADGREGGGVIAAERRTHRWADLAGAETDAAAGGREDDAAGVVDGGGEARHRSGQNGATSGALGEGGRGEVVLAGEGRETIGNPGRWRRDDVVDVVDRRIRVPARWHREMRRKRRGAAETARLLRRRCRLSGQRAHNLLAQASKIGAGANGVRDGAADLRHCCADNVDVMVGLPTILTSRATQY